MELSGRIIAVLPERSGTSARGEWKAQSFVIETHDQYPRKMVFDVFGAERLQRFNIKSGDEVTNTRAVGSTTSAHSMCASWMLPLELLLARLPLLTHRRHRPHRLRSLPLSPMLPESRPTTCPSKHFP